MSDLALSSESPFEAIKQARADGTHFWSARRLMPLMGYDKWQNFATAIDRARVSAQNVGEDVSRLFTDVSKNSGGRPQEDIELDRQAAYLTALNGDPRKPESANAQAYFVARTQQAEQVERVLVTAIDDARAKAGLLQAFKGLIDPKHLEAKARIVLARALGEAPELNPADKPLYAQTFLEEKGLGRARIKAVSGPFGKRVKAAYVLEHGAEPNQYPLETSNGQVRDVNAYTESDRPLMEAIWSKYYDGESA